MLYDRKARVWLTLLLGLLAETLATSVRHVDGLLVGLLVWVGKVAVACSS